MKIQNLFAAAGWLCLVAAVSGCATITKGTDQNVTVQSIPSGAECELRRDGKVIGIVNPTPGTVNVHKSQANIAVTCRQDGYQDSSATLSSELQGMTFGNILFGGIIGAAIDAGSGAMHKYPDSVNIAMAPLHFSTPEDRDTFYVARAAEVKRDTDAAIAKIRLNCKPSNQKACDEAVKKLESMRDAQLADLEIRRAGGEMIVASGPEVESVVPDIRVTQSVMDDIAMYHRQTSTGGKAWALAIAKDGSHVTSASCVTVGWSGSINCSPAQGQAQALASRNAIKNCGGPDTCILLYEGEIKKSDLEVGF